MAYWVSSAFSSHNVKGVTAEYRTLNGALTIIRAQ